MKILWLIFLTCSMWACKTKKINPANADEIIIIGNGGGFTGISTSYYILPDGGLYRGGMSDTSFIKVGEIDELMAKQQFSTYDNLNFDKIELNDPGNRYFFITRIKDGKEHKIQWGRSALENQNIAIYHKNMMELIKQLDKK